MTNASPMMNGHNERLLALERRLNLLEGTSLTI